MVLRSYPAYIVPKIRELCNKVLCLMEAQVDNESRLLASFQKMSLFWWCLHKLLRWLLLSFVAGTSLSRKLQPSSPISCFQSQQTDNDGSQRIIDGIYVHRRDAENSLLRYWQRSRRPGDDYVKGMHLPISERNGSVKTQMIPFLLDITSSPSSSFQ